MLLPYPFICCWYEMHERKVYWSGRVCLSVCISEVSKSVALWPIWITFRINVVPVCPCIVPVNLSAPEFFFSILAHSVYKM